jgi:Tfp pilus assembly PilM family ATPase/Tfp pilus assembly protein PilN
MAGSVPIIGMEVTSTKVRLVEVVTQASALEVTNFALLDLPPEGLKDLVSTLLSILRENNFRGKKVNALLSYPSINFLQVPLPPMSKGDLRLAASREAKKDIKMPEGGLVYDFEPVGDSEEKGVPKKEVLIARANSRDVQEYLKMLKEANLHPNSLSVLPAVVLNLLRMRGGPKEETLAGICVGEDKGTIVILHQGGLRFPRDFPLKLTGEVEGLQVRLAAELKRSLLYLKQRARGLEPQRVILLGEIDRPKELTEALTQEVGIKTEMYIPPGLDLSPLRERMEEFRDSLQQFTLPIGLAWDGPERSELNLLAEEVQTRKRLRMARLAVASLAILFAIFLIGRSTWLWTSGRPYWKNLRQAKEELATLQPKIKEMAKVTEERNRQKLRLAFLGKTIGPETGWERILRTLSLVVPPEMCLESLELKETPENWTLNLKGRVLASNVSIINNRFQEFFSLFLTTPAFADARVEYFKIGPATEEGKTAPNPPGSAAKLPKKGPVAKEVTSTPTSSSRLEFAVVVKIKYM